MGSAKIWLKQEVQRLAYGSENGALAAYSGHFKIFLEWRDGQAHVGGESIDNGYRQGLLAVLRGGWDGWVALRDRVQCDDCLAPTPAPAINGLFGEFVCSPCMRGKS